MKDNAAAADMIMSTVDNGQIKHILIIKEAAEQWRVLKQIHEALNKKRLWLLLSKFYPFEIGDRSI